MFGYSKESCDVTTRIVSEYDQEITQSQTAGKPMAPTTYL